MTVTDASNPITVLVVDDNADDLAMFQRAVKSQNWKVATAESGREGLQRALKERFDVVVLDYNLGDMTGTEVLLRLKEQGVATPVLIQSGIGSHFIVARALTLGAEGFISKDSPSYAQDVITKLSSAAERARTVGWTAPRLGRREGLQEVETVLDDLLDQARGQFTAVGFASPDGFRISTRFKTAHRLSPETICAMVASATSTCHFLGEGVNVAGRLRMVSADFEGGQFLSSPIASFGILFVVTSDRQASSVAQTELQLAAQELSTLLSTMTRAESYAR